MTKNKAMRLGSFLLVLALLTMCAVSGTFAKYVSSSDKASDNARVAKWGVVINDPEDTDTFKVEYVTDDTEVVGTIAKSVKSASTDKVVAPGTDGTVATPTVEGTPEVAVKLGYSDANVELANWNTTAGDTNTYYCPLVFTIDGTDYEGVKYASATLFEQALEKAINDCTKNYAPNTDLSAETNAFPKITWKWAFETGTNDIEKAANNVKDTALGNLATAPTVKVELKASAVQID